MRVLVFYVLGLITAITAAAQPAQVFLFRHAEKPDDEAALHLSTRGRERAEALVKLLGKGTVLATNAPIAAIYATRVTKHGHGARTSETVTPLARDLALPVLTPYPSELGSRLARDVLTNPAYRGKSVVICWTHHEIAELAAALGVRPAPEPWKDKVFDRLWIIRPAERSADLENLPQRLLKGDSKR